MLRDYQQKLIGDVFSAWNSGARNVLMVSPTGSGKTHTKTAIAKQANVVTCNIAHRQELVLQISCSLAKFGLYHNVIAPTGVVRFCAQRHTILYGRSYINQDADMAVGSVQTFLRRQEQLATFINRTKLWDIDEGHHALPDNQWGKCVMLFQSAFGLGVTATPLRADRKGLDGVYDHMVVGPTMRDLIDQGHLSDYRIFCPPESIDLAKVSVGSSGDFVKKQLDDASDQSTIVGDIVGEYLKIAPGQRGLTFTVNVRAAEEVAAAYNAAGVPAAFVSGNTPDRIRTDALDRLARGELKQIVNVDLFGEGMDCPTLEVISMGRPTQSYGLFVQQFGRVLRTSDGKTHGTVIDHVGNVIRHGLPDAPRQWSLSAPEGNRKGSTDPDVIGLKACTACFRPYERHRVACPYCGAVPVPAGRTEPKMVDGDLVEMTPEFLASLRGDISRIDGDVLIPAHVDEATAISIRNRWIERQRQQQALRDCIAMWAGMFKYGHGETDREIQKRFYLTFGVDIMTAQTLGSTDAIKLATQVRDTIT